MLSMNDTNAGQPNQGTAQQTANAASPAQASAAATATAQTKPTMTQPLSSFRSLSERNATPVSTVNASGSLRLLIESLDKIKAEVNTGGQYVFDYRQINAEEYGLYMSAIILTLQKAHAPNSGLSFHTLLLADTAKKLPGTAQLPIQGPNGIVTQVDVLRVPGDAYDDKYKSVINRIVDAAFPTVPASRKFSAEAEVLPLGYHYTDQTTVLQTVHNASQACLTVLNGTDDNFDDFTLGGGSNNPLNVRLSFHQPQLINAVGEPVRADVRIEITDPAQSTQQVRQGELPSMNAGAGEKVISTISGFIELVWNPEEPQALQNPWMRTANPQTKATNRLYSPRFVITSIDAGEFSTLPALLLQLATTPVLHDRGNWVGALWNQISGSRMHDIGWIGVEAGWQADGSIQPGTVGQYIDTQAQSFTRQVMGALVDAFVRPELIISIDVPEVGPETWQSSVLLAAARGNQGAANSLAGAANLLTNGVFGRVFQELGGGPFVIDERNRIHLGNYTVDGVARDIRDVDHLVVLQQLGTTDRDSVTAYSDSFLRTEFPVEQRMAGRRPIIEHIAGPNTKFTGYAQRVTLSANFLIALAKSVSQLANVRPVVPFQDQTGLQRATAIGLQAGAMNANTPAFFNRPYATGPVQSTPQGYGRWNQ